MNGMEQLLAFIARLREAKIQFTLQCVRDAIMVTVVSPLAYREIEFFADGEIAVQTFKAGDVVGMALDEITKVVMDELTGPADDGSKH
jgi:hypothetical protein